MRLAIDASRTTVARVTGTERYALEIIRSLIQQNAEHEIKLYFRDAPPPDLLPASRLVTERVIPFKRAWTHLRFSAALWQDRPDVTFVPAHTLPFAFPGRALVTVHDLGFKYFPQAHPTNERRYLDLTTHYSTRRATTVLADSQATANDLKRFYGTPSDKMRVVYPGVSAPEIGNLEAVRLKYNLPERYFLFIGTLQPRKNIAGMVRAYSHYREQSDDPAGFVLAGGQGWLYDESWVAGVPGVQLIGYIDEADKGALYAEALGLLFTTLYEGFGFPVLEAMHCGTAVIASTTSSLPELVGEAGLLVEPDDPHAIAGAMQRLEDDPALRRQLREKGDTQARKFTWDAAAQQILALLAVF